MALLVTVLLMMINFAIKMSDNSPSKSTFSALDFWMLGNAIDKRELIFQLVYF